MAEISSFSDNASGPTTSILHPEPILQHLAESGDNLPKRTACVLASRSRGVARMPGLRKKLGPRKKLSAFAEKLLAKCVDEGWPARIAAGLLDEKTGLKLSERTVARRMSEMRPDEDADVRRLLNVFVDLVVERIRSLRPRPHRESMGQKQQ